MMLVFVTSSKQNWPSYQTSFSQIQPLYLVAGGRQIHAALRSLLLPESPGYKIFLTDWWCVNTANNQLMTWQGEIPLKISTSNTGGVSPSVPLQFFPRCLNTFCKIWLIVSKLHTQANKSQHWEIYHSHLCQIETLTLTLCYRNLT